MALTTVDEVRAAGGIDEPDAHLTFRLPDPAALDLVVQKGISWGAAWLQLRVLPEHYTGSVTLNLAKDEIFKAAEESLAIYYVLPRLKIRRVLGTHWAVDQEGSERFQELIDTELLAQVETSIGIYAIVETVGETAYLPQFAATQVATPSVGINQLIQDAITEATGWTPAGTLL